MSVAACEVYLPLLVVLPLAAAVLAVLLRERTGMWLGVGVTLVLAVLSFHLAGSVAGHGPVRYALGGWSSPLGIALYVDGLSAVMLILTSVVALAISIFSADYFTGKKVAQGKRFWPLWLFLIGGMNALYASGDLFNLYVTLEIVTLSAVAMVALEGSALVLSAALRYLLLAVTGSLAYLTGVALLYSTYGSLDLVGLSELVRPGLPTWTALAALTVSLMMKGALFPLHVWLPPAHANAPAPVSAALSSLVVTAAFYLAARFWGTIFAPLAQTAAIGHMLGLCGALAVLWGAFQAVRQARLKLLIAYSTVSQMGYPFLAFGLLAGRHDVAFAWGGGILFAVAHGFAKAAAFLAAGVLMAGFGHDRLKDLGGGAGRYPMAVMALALAGVNLMGLPPSGGFVAKWMMLKAAMISGQWPYVAVILAGSLLAACYIFRALECTLRLAGDGPEPRGVPPRMQWAALGLALVAVLLGHLASFPLDVLDVGVSALAGGVAP